MGESNEPGLSGAKAWLGRNAVAWTAVVFVAGALLGGLLIWAPWRDDSEQGRFDFSSTEVPGEYLYLDPERVVSYLAQIRGGIAETETQTESSSETASASAGTTLSAGVERRREAGVSRVVTATTAADFLNLIDKLQDTDLQQPIRVKEADARQAADTREAAAAAFAADVMNLVEGDFVIVRNVRILMPLHIRPYEAIDRLGPTSFSEDPRTLEDIRRYAAAIGEDPKVVFNVGAHTARDDGAPLAGVLPDGRVRPGCPVTGWPAFGRRWPVQAPANARVLLPVRYSLLAPESSLLSGGDSIVVGKVVRVLREPEDPAAKPRESDVCFTDQQARNAFELTADRIPQVVASSLPGVNRQNIQESLDTYAQVRAPAAIVLPVAIYR
jgi:hypothetical protein